MLATGPRALSVTSPGSALALSGSSVADLNMGFVWADVEALTRLQDREEDFLIVASEEGDGLLGPVAADFNLEKIPDPLPVWMGDVSAAQANPTHGAANPPGALRHVDPAEMDVVRSILSQAFGVDSDELAVAFPDSIARDIDVHVWEQEGIDVSAVMAIREGDFVSLWSGGTLPDYQGEGAFTDLLRAVLSDQRLRGAKEYAAITEAVGSAKALERVGARRHAAAHVWIRGSSVGELLQTP